MAVTDDQVTALRAYLRAKTDAEAGDAVPKAVAGVVQLSADLDGAGRRRC